MRSQGPSFDTTFGGVDLLDTMRRPRLPIRLGPLTVVAGIRCEQISPTVMRQVDIAALVVPAGDLTLTVELCRIPGAKPRLLELPEVQA